MSTLNALVCHHCGYPLEAEKGDKYDVCRFCRRSYRVRCPACSEGRDHGNEQ